MHKIYVFKVLDSQKLNRFRKSEKYSRLYPDPLGTKAEVHHDT